MKKENNAKLVKLALSVVFIILLIVLGIIIALQAKQAKSERAQESAVIEATTTPEADAEAEAAEAAAKEQAAKAEEAAREAERAKKAEEAAQYSFYQKLANGYEVKMLIMGDSIISGTGASSDSTAWFSLLEDYIDEKYYAGDDCIAIENASGAGHKLCTDYFAVKESDLASDCDVAVLCYGHDDPDTDFAVYYEALIRAIHTKNPDCSIIYVLESSEGGHTPRMINLENVCTYYNIPIADTFAPYYDLGEADFFTAFADAIHPNDKGHQIYFETIRDVIDELVTADTGKPEDIERLSGSASLFDNLLYFPADKFERVDDVTFSITAAESASVHGVLMLEANYPITYTDAKVVADGMLYNIQKSAATIEDVENSRYLLTVYKDFILTDSLTVTFTEKTFADGFTGIYLLWETPVEK